MANAIKKFTAKYGSKILRRIQKHSNDDLPRSLSNIGLTVEAFLKKKSTCLAKRVKVALHRAKNRNIFAPNNSVASKS